MPTLDYQDPPTRSPFPGRLLGAVVAADFVFGLSLLAAGKFKEIFRDFGVSLPLPTRVLLELTRTVTRDYNWIALIPLLAAPIAAVIAVHWQSPGGISPHTARRLARVCWVLISLWILLTALALMVPMVTLIESVSGPKGK